MSRKVIAIAAMDQGRVIGYKNSLPWNLPEDMRRFKELTMGHAVLMGRKTFESLPDKFKPLPGRTNIVASNQLESLEQFPAVQICNDLQKYLESFKAAEGQERLWIIGGEKIYRASLPFWDELYLTRVNALHQGDAFFPEFEQGFELLEESVNELCSFQHYRRI